MKHTLFKKNGVKSSLADRFGTHFANVSISKLWEFILRIVPVVEKKMHWKSLPVKSSKIASPILMLGKV